MKLIITPILKILGFHPWKYEKLITFFKRNQWTVLSSNFTSDNSFSVLIIAKKKIKA
ncbi:hypothetical protein [Clostridium sp. Marseille-Q7071]